MYVCVLVCWCWYNQALEIGARVLLFDEVCWRAHTPALPPPTPPHAHILESESQHACKAPCTILVQRYTSCVTVPFLYQDVCATNAMIRDSKMQVRIWLAFIYTLPSQYPIGTWLSYVIGSGVIFREVLARCSVFKPCMCTSCPLYEVNPRHVGLQFTSLCAPSGPVCVPVRRPWCTQTRSP